MKNKSLVFGIVFLSLGGLIFLSWATGRTYRNIQFTRYCKGHLKLAADANTVDLAIGELDIALAYIERKNLTTGFTSILYTTPDEDIGFWYKNLSASRTELRNLPPTAAPLERTNVLMKLRETLLDQSDGGVSVTYPDAIAIYPDNTCYAVSCWICVIFMAIGGTILAIQMEKTKKKVTVAESS